jgi:NAD(P)-dependent dehydrogenase (short-subunit alcohol dehydrogenase family)
VTSSGWALVTGASRGIGRAAAVELAQLSNVDIVVGTSRSTHPASDVATMVRYDSSQDPAMPPDIPGLSEKYGQLRVLVLNSGEARDDFLIHMNPADWDRVIRVNLLSLFDVLQPALVQMTRNHYGRVVFVSSVAAYGGADGQSNYAAAKAGVVGLARSIAREYARRSITSNVVCPGPIQTDMLATMPESRLADLLERVPSGRVGTPADVGRAISFLASPDSGYINGAVLPVDGGLGMGH